MQSTNVVTAHNSDGSITYGGPGYGVKPCPTCGGALLPTQTRRVMPGVWRPYHEVCPAVPERHRLCSICSGQHSDGMCLL